jgi:hypothetical protein
VLSVAAVAAITAETEDKHETADRASVE